MFSLVSALHRLLRLLFTWVVRRSSGEGVLEVERKFSITESESEVFSMRLRELGFEPHGTCAMIDTFLPAVEKGEMLRVREENYSGERKTILTHKRWVATSTGKERHEFEARVLPIVRVVFIILGRIVAGRPLLSFAKERALYQGTRNGKTFTVSVDRVTGLGRFSGHYLEVEVLVPEEEDPKEVPGQIFQLVTELLGERRDDIRQSYLEMLELSRR